MKKKLFGIPDFLNVDVPKTPGNSTINFVAPQSTNIDNHVSAQIELKFKNLVDTSFTPDVIRKESDLVAVANRICSGIQNFDDETGKVTSSLWPKHEFFSKVTELTSSATTSEEYYFIFFIVVQNLTLEEKQPYGRILEDHIRKTIPAFKGINTPEKHFFVEKLSDDTLLVAPDIVAPYFIDWSILNWLTQTYLDNEVFLSQSLQFFSQHRMVVICSFTVLAKCFYYLSDYNIRGLDFEGVDLQNFSQRVRNTFLFFASNPNKFVSQAKEAAGLKLRREFAEFKKSLVQNGWDFKWKNVLKVLFGSNETETKKSIPQPNVVMKDDSPFLLPNGRMGGGIFFPYDKAPDVKKKPGPKYITLEPPMEVDL